MTTHRHPPSDEHTSSTDRTPLTGTERTHT